MKKLALIGMMGALLPAAALAQLWTGTASSVFDAPGNWSPRAPLDGEGTADIRIQPLSDGVERPNYPMIDSSTNHQWGVGRFRGTGLKLNQTGGTFEWLNGSGRSSKGITIQSRKWEYPTGNTPANPCVVKLTGGTMITDAVGLGVPGGLNSGTLHSDWPNGGGDYAEDTINYRNWQLAAGDDRYGWGRLQIQGDATLIVRPNIYVWPIGYTETNAFWVYADTNAPTADWYSRVFDIAIGTNSQMVISDNAKLVAPYKIYTNAIVTYANDPDLLTQLQYYAGLVQAGASPHYVSNGAIGSPRLIAGPGQTLQFDLFPAGTNEVNEPYGGYLTVTAVPAPFVNLEQSSAANLAVSGLVGRQYQIESTDDLSADWTVRTNFTLATSTQTWADPTPSPTQRFYRAALLPLP